MLQVVVIIVRFWQRDAGAQVYYVSPTRHSQRSHTCDRPDPVYTSTSVRDSVRNCVQVFPNPAMVLVVSLGFAAVVWTLRQNVPAVAVVNRLHESSLDESILHVKMDLAAVPAMVVSVSAEIADGPAVLLAEYTVRLQLLPLS